MNTLDHNPPENIKQDQLQKMLKESNIDGGKTMQTLGSRLRAEGMKEEKFKTAKELLKRGVDINIILRATGLSKREVDKLTHTNHSPAASL